ncbi:RNA-directed DNA polymerase, eukaryota, reverse transcriptase zinc-binding domain protein [Tanacetum coccineum]|uniref:RNA-directed DNA polymerase, eukaryota, reverse transcriptase zinc-binding domain protein n=1 Tax=Tanacetum coccineum TaxID=301880 RepID=A0ABQ4YZY0_9ASTR
MSRIQDWREVIDKMKHRLSKWKMKSLSIGGRLTLLKSVLGSIPIFNMSIFKVPLMVLKEMESIRGRFFNGHEFGSRKASWIKWEKVLASKDKGGLGVSSLFALNRGLLIKWVWRFFNKESSLWKKVIVAIHGADGNICSGKRFVSKTCWSSIVYEVHRMKSNGINIFDFMKLRVGNGQTTRFWFDDWYQGGVLKDLCPRMYALETCKDVSVYEKMQNPSVSDSFRRENQGGVSRLSLMWGVLREWLIVTLVSLRTVGYGIWDSIRWVKSVPIKVNVLSWKVMVEALPTRLNMSRRGISIPSIMCPVCDEEVESVNHLFFRCKVCYQIGKKVLKWWNMSDQEVNSYAEWSVWMASIRIRSKLKEIFEGVWINSCGSLVDDVIVIPSDDDEADDQDEIQEPVE